MTSELLDAWFTLAVLGGAALTIASAFALFVYGLGTCVAGLREDNLLRWLAGAALVVLAGVLFFGALATSIIVLNPTT